MSDFCRGYNVCSKARIGMCQNWQNNRNGEDENEFLKWWRNEN